MPLFDFRCEGGHVERDVLLRGAQSPSAPRKCPTCAAPSKRVFSSFQIGGATAGESMLESEQKNWALATGEKHKSEADVARWCKENGKELVEKGYTPKPPPEPFTDLEFDKALKDVYKENHSLGEIG